MICASRAALGYKSDMKFRPPPGWLKKSGKDLGKAAGKAAKSDAAKKAGVAAGGAVASAAAGAATDAVTGSSGAVRSRLSGRGQRRMAKRLARQMKARYSTKTIIGNDLHCVVWKNGKPFRAFPPVQGDLATLPELQDFPAELMREP